MTFNCKSWDSACNPWLAVLSEYLRMSAEVTRMSEVSFDEQKKGRIEQIRKEGADEQCTARQTHN